MNSIQLFHICETCKQEKQRQLFINLYREKEYKHCYECRLNFMQCPPNGVWYVKRMSINQSSIISIESIRYVTLVMMY